MSCQMAPDSREKIPQLPISISIRLILLLNSLSSDQINTVEYQISLSPHRETLEHLGANNTMGTMAPLTSPGKGCKFWWGKWKDSKCRSRPLPPYLKKIPSFPFPVTLCHNIPCIFFISLITVTWISIFLCITFLLHYNRIFLRAGTRSVLFWIAKCRK